MGTQACALTGNPTNNLLLRGTTPNQLSHASGPGYIILESGSVPKYVWEIPFLSCMISQTH